MCIKKFFFLYIFIQLFYEHDLVEPLNLKVPTNFDVPTETFTLCDLNHEFFRDYCMNKGICYVLVNQDKKEKYVSEENKEFKPEIFCSCASEYTGTRCETNLNTIVDTYMLINQTYSEKSPAVVTDFNNNKSETQIENTSSILFMKNNNKNSKANSTLTKLKSSSNECPPFFRCLNGGKCIIEEINGPMCLCTPDYEGLNCGQRKLCPGMQDCRLNCDFGYMIKDNCETCKCNCVNEDNYFKEIRKSFQLENTRVKLTQFCKKSCILGYTKDDFGCFKCSCIEDVLISQEKTEHFTKTSTKLNTVSSTATKEPCLNVKCKSKEVCKTLNTKLYRCPDGDMYCKLYENSNKIPVCVSNKYPEQCMDLLEIGDCQNYTRRFYFDIVDKKCKMFYFSGCNQNRNNFASFEECSSICLKDSITSAKSNPNKNNAHSIQPRSSTISTTTRKAEEIKTMFIPNIDLKPFVNNVNTESTMEVDYSTTCQWICDLNCPFGYKLNFTTNCYKCECIDLNMTDCGVPCFLTGTKSCLYAQRANSRPKCVCNTDYEGVYCQTLNVHLNFTVRINSSFKLNDAITNEIKNNLSKEISRRLDYGLKHVTVNQLSNNPKDNSLTIQFSIHAPDYSTSASFFETAEIFTNNLNKKNVTIKILGKDYTLMMQCDRLEANFAMDLNENYFSGNKLRQMISDLKLDVTKAYKFEMDSIDSVKIKIEPNLQLEFLIKNKINDSDFCRKTFYLNSDIHTKLFTLSKLDAKYLEVPVQGKRLLNDRSDETFDPNNLYNEENIFLSRDPNLHHHLTTPAFLKHSFVLIAVIVVSFLVLIFLVALVIVTQLRHNQRKKNLKKSSDTTSIISMSDTKNTHKLSGYFMPNYSRQTSKPN